MWGATNEQTCVKRRSGSRYPRAYEHRHALHPPHAKFSCKGPAEMFRLVNKIDPLIDGNESVTIQYNHPSGKKKLNLNLPQRQIYSSPPHICADNFFSQDELMDYLGEKGYGMTMTCR